MTPFPVFEDNKRTHSVVVYGWQDRLQDKTPSLLEHIKGRRGNPLLACLVLQAEGFGVYLPQVPDYKTPIKAGGVRLTEAASVAIIQSQDAPIVILRDRKTNNIVVSRAGRYALLQRKSDCALCEPPGIIENSVQMLVGHATRQNIEALVVAGICGTCFKHEHHGAREFVTPFFDRYGPKVFANHRLGSLDLFSVITLQLTALGVPVENISRADHCTFEHKRLASHRLHHQPVNTVMVVRR